MIDLGIVQHYVHRYERLLRERLLRDGKGGAESKTRTVDTDSGQNKTRTVDKKGVLLSKHQLLKCKFESVIGSDEPSSKIVLLHVST